jgi:hypothetical protein
MEQKKSVVKSAIFRKANSGQNGLYYIHDITFENGDTGVYFSKNETQDTFKQGQEAEYTIEAKVNGQYTNYSIKPVAKAGFVPGKGNPAFEHKRTALRCAVDLVVAGKIELKQVSEYAKSFMKFLNE